MKCAICGSKDNFYKQGNIIYCRKCIKYINRKQISVKQKDIDTRDISYQLSFKLTPIQEKISKQLVENIKHHLSTNILAVCGSGKTEITYQVILEELLKGHRVCFTLPRKALCIELYERFTSSFKNLDIGLLVGGIVRNEDASLIICTTHQLYQFINTPFDLLILDEADAFPYYQDDVLEAILHKCIKGSFIKMSATLTSKDIKEGETLILNRRYHGHILPVPHIKKIPSFAYIIFTIRKITSFLNESKKVIIYVPTKKYLYHYIRIFSHFFIVKGVSSDTKNINTYIHELREGKIEVLISTTILERGITITNLQVIVLHASHNIFDERTLIQIAGRVGRTIGYETGDILFIDNKMSKDMKTCIQTIHHLNSIDA